MLLLLLGVVMQLLVVLLLRLRQLSLRAQGLLLPQPADRGDGP